MLGIRFFLDMVNPKQQNLSTEEAIEFAFDLIMGGGDPNLVYDILIESNSFSEEKAQTIVRWAIKTSKDKGWIK